MYHAGILSEQQGLDLFSGAAPARTHGQPATQIRYVSAHGKPPPRHRVPSPVEHSRLHPPTKPLTFPRLEGLDLMKRESLGWRST